MAIKAMEDVAKSGKKMTREDVSAAVRKVKLSGITGEIAFDSKGDRLKAQYFVLTVVSDNPEKWGDNKIVKQLTIAPPPVKK
jgi:branched-chain amino acid transport system substrate-binding protein